MDKKFPPPSRFFSGYEEELDLLNQANKEKVVTYLWGEYGIGKTELCLFFLNQINGKKKYKEYYFLCTPKLTAEDFFSSLFSILTGSSRENFDSKSLEDKVKTWLQFIENKKSLVLIENFDFLEQEYQDILFSNLTRYIQNSRFIINSRSEISIPSQQLHFCMKIKLEGLKSNDLSSLAQKLKITKEYPVGVFNPAAFLILSSSDNLENRRLSFEKWLASGFSNEEYSYLQKWICWEEVPLSVFQSLASSEKEYANLLLERGILLQRDRSIYVKDWILKFFPMDKISKNRYHLYIKEISELLPLEDSVFHRFLLGTLHEPLIIEAYSNRLVDQNRLTELNRLALALINRGLFLVNVLKCTIEKNVESEDFEFANKILEFFESDLDLAKKLESDIYYVNAICELSYYSKDLDRFHESVLNFESLRLKHASEHEAEIDYLHWKALEHRMNRKYLDSISIREKAILLFNEDTKYKSKFRHFFNLGVDLFWCSEYEKSYEASKQAYQLAMRNDSVSSLQISSCNMFLALDELERFNEAGVILERLKSSLSSNANPSLQISIAFFERSKFFDDNRLVSAISYLEDPVLNFKKLGTKNQQIAVELYMAELNIEMGFLNKAKQHLSKSQDLFISRDKNPYKWRYQRLQLQILVSEFNKEDLLVGINSLEQEISTCEDMSEKLKLLGLMYIAYPPNKVDGIEKQILELIEEKTEFKKTFDINLIKNQRRLLHGHVGGAFVASSNRKFVQQKGMIYTALVSLFNHFDFQLDLNSIDPESLWQKFVAKALVCLKSALQGEFVLANKLLEEYDGKSFETSEKGYDLAIQLFRMAGVFVCIKSNQWDRVSVYLIGLRKGFLNSHQNFVLNFQELAGEVFRHLNFGSKGSHIFNDFLLGNSDIYLISTHKVIANQQLVVVNLESKKILFDIFMMLFHSSGPVSKEQLITHIWNQEYNPIQHDQVIYVNISRLKKILETELGFPDIILNESSVYFLSSRLKFSEV